MMNEDLNRAVLQVINRQKYYLIAEAYYEGHAKEVFASHQMRQLLKGRGDQYTVNYCRPVVDAVLNRLELANITGTTQKATDAIGDMFQDDDLTMTANEIHRRALEYGDSYALVWPDDDGDYAITYQSPLNCTIVYDFENPQKKLYGVKMWTVTSPDLAAIVTQTFCNLYYPDRIEKYTVKGEVIGLNPNWTLLDVVENPFGQIPLFHFRTHRPFGRPEHYDAYPLQDMINKTTITHMFTMDYQGAPQRYALSNFGNESELSDFEDGATDRENIGTLKNGPGELWYLKGVNQVGEFKPADPQSFLMPLKAFVEDMAAVTQTPMHFLSNIGRIPAGDALRTAEAPLLKKVADRQLSFGQTWRELMLFLLGAEAISADVTVKWLTVESLDSLGVWDVMLKKINAGLSHKQALREGGYDEQEIDKIMKERDEEAANNQYYTRAPVTRVNTNADETAPTNTTDGEANAPVGGNG